MRVTSARVLGRYLVVVLATLRIASPGQAASGGSSRFAQACKNGGFLNWERFDGTDFASTQECISYGKQQGTLYPRSSLTFDVSGANGVAVVTVNGAGLAVGSEMKGLFAFEFRDVPTEYVTTVGPNGTATVTFTEECRSTSRIAARATTSDGRAISDFQVGFCP